MSSAKLGNQERPQSGKQVRQAPAWEIGEAGRQVGVQAGPVGTDQVDQDDIEEWCLVQHEEQPLDNLLDDKSIQEDTKQMEGVRSKGRDLTRPKSPFGTFREPEYQPHCRQDVRS